MLHQAILPFKLERTDEMITPRSGLVVFAELVRAFEVKQRVERSFPRPGSNRGYEAWSYLEPLLLMMEGGGRHVEDLREIQDDVALRALVGLEKMPSLSTFGDWLARTGAQGGYGHGRGQRRGRGGDPRAASGVGLHARCGHHGDRIGEEGGGLDL